MKTNRVNNFINFLYEETEENNRIIEEELEEAGLDTGKFQQKMLDLLDEKERELKIERGKKLKELYLNLKGRIHKPEGRVQDSMEEYNLQMAYRNFESNLTDQEKIDILSDDQLLDEIDKKLEKK